MARLMELEQQQAREHRGEVREQIQASNARTEKLIQALTEQVGELARTTSAGSMQHASQGGAWALSRWLFGAVLAVATLSAGWLGGKRGVMEAPCIQQQQQRPAAAQPHSIIKAAPGP